MPDDRGRGPLDDVDLLIAAICEGNRPGFEPLDEGSLDPARHPTRAVVEGLEKDRWSGERTWAT